MTIPRRLREQFRLYEQAGFTVKAVEPASRHYKVQFNEFAQPQYLTANQTDRRAYLNNITRFKRLCNT